MGVEVEVEVETGIEAGAEAEAEAGIEVMTGNSMTHIKEVEKGTEEADLSKSTFFHRYDSFRSTHFIFWLTSTTLKDLMILMILSALNGSQQTTITTLMKTKTKTTMIRGEEDIDRRKEGTKRL